jgi:hypothetical protein
MRYMLLVYGDEGAWANLSEQERAAVSQKFVAFSKEVEQRGVKELNALPQPSMNAKTVRTQNGRLQIVDGPYAQTKEQISGVYILNCEDLDEALEYAERIPRGSGIVEVRPLVGI